MWRDPRERGMVAHTPGCTLCHKQLPAITAAGATASLHPPSADAALVQATPGSLAHPAGECTLCMCCRGVPRHRAWALLPGAAPSSDQTSSFTLCTARKFSFLGDPWLWPFQLSSFYQDFERNWGKNCDWPNFVKTKMPRVVRYTLMVHICTSSTQLEYLYIKDLDVNSILHSEHLF